MSRWGEIDTEHCKEMEARFYEPVTTIQQWIERYRSGSPTDECLIAVEELEALLPKVQLVADEATDSYWQSSSAYNC